MGERAALNNSSSRSCQLKMKLGPGVNFFYITPQLGQQEANRVSDTVSNMGLKRSPSSITVNGATGMGLKKKEEKHRAAVGPSTQTDAKVTPAKLSVFSLV